MERKLFYKYLLVYTGLFLIMVMGSLLVAHTAEQAVRTRLYAESALKLDKGALRLEQAIVSMRSASENLYALESITRLRNEKDVLRIENYPEMNYARKQLRILGMVGNLPYGFMLFRDNPIFLSDTQVAADFEMYYNQFMQADAYTGAQWKEILFARKEEISFLSLDTLQYYDERPVTLSKPLLVVIKPRTSKGEILDSQCLVFVLPREVVMEYFLTDTIMDNAIVYVCDYTGEYLLQYGDQPEGETFSDAEWEKVKGDGYQLIRTQILDGRMQLFVGIARSTARSQADLLSRGIKVVLFVSIAYTFLVTAFLAWKKYKPTKRMLEQLSREVDQKVTAANEYEYVEKTVGMLSQRGDRLREELVSLKEKMDNSILENVLLHGVISRRDKEMLGDILPPYLDYYYVFVFRSEDISQDNLYEISHCLMGCFTRFYGEYLYVIHAEMSEEVFLVRQSKTEEIDLEEIKRKLKTVVLAVTKQTDAVFGIGVSGIGYGIDQMNNCYEQAKQACIYGQREHENTIACYAETRRQTGNATLDVTLLFHLYDFILMGNKEAIGISMDKLQRFCKRRGNPRRNREIYYSLVAIMSSAGEKLGYEEKSDFGWKPGQDVCSQVEELKAHIYAMIDFHEDNKKSHNVELKDNIITYLKEHYQDQNLTALEVCEAMHISEKYLAQFLKEQTLKTFSRYLEEIRVEKAKEYLVQTQWNNKQIAEAAGFGSLNTFYRVFQKAEGMTPANWKKQHRDNQNLYNNKEGEYQNEDSNGDETDCQAPGGMSDTHPFLGGTLQGREAGGHDGGERGGLR